MSKFLVEVCYETLAGNPSCKKALIESNSVEDALNLLTKRVERYKKCKKIYMGNCIEITKEL